MKQLNAPDFKADLAEMHPVQVRDYDGVYAAGYYGAAEQSDEKQLLKQILSTLRRHWALILSITLLATIATSIYVAQKPDYYKASARVQVNTENNPALGGRAGSAIVVNNPGSDPAYFTTQLQVLETAGLMRRVIKSLDLENNPGFLDPQRGRRPTILQNLGKMLGLYRAAAPGEGDPVSKAANTDRLNLVADSPLDPDEETERLAPLVNALKKNLVVSPVKDSRTASKETRLIEIEVTHGDPALAAKIANAFGDAYVLQNLEQKVQSNASAGDFLQKRVADLQSAIRLGQEKLINYSKENQIISLDAGQNTVVQKLVALSQQLGQAENDRIAAQTAYQAALQNQMRAAAAESTDPQIVGLETKLNDLRQKLAQLKTEYTDEWPEVVLTKKQIESVENQLLPLRRRASDVQIAALQQKLNEAAARENELRNNFNLQRASVIRQNEASINYNIIQQEIDTNKALLQSVLERSRTNDVILNDTPNNVLVADRATVPSRPAGPERMTNVLLAFLVSLGAACGLAFLIEWLDDSVRNSESVESSLGLPLLGCIPATPKSLNNRLFANKLALRKRNRHRNDRYDLTAFEKPEFAEAYLQLRTHLMLARAGGPPRTILVTSGEEREGKTLTALNLALSLAKISDKVLLIDADLRWPRIDVIRELNNHAGLTTLLTSSVVDDQLIDKMIHKDPLTDIHILTAGERSVNPTSLLSSKEMQTLLELLSKRYSHIVIDSPPVLFFADSTILSTMVDSVVIVVRDNYSSRQSVLKTRKLIQSVGGRIVGFVLNGVPRRNGQYAKYGYYEPESDPGPASSYEALKLN